MSEKSSPVHMSGAVDAPPFSNADWAWNVVHRNAPGAISAIAFTVTPVSVRLRLISPLPGAGVSAMGPPLAARRRGPERHRLDVGVPQTAVPRDRGKARLRVREDRCQTATPPLRLSVRKLTARSQVSGRRSETVGAAPHEAVEEPAST